MQQLKPGGGGGGWICTANRKSTLCGCAKDTLRCTFPTSPRAGRSRSGWDREFESGFLQRRVRNELSNRLHSRTRHEAPLTDPSQVCAPPGAHLSADTARCQEAAERAYFKDLVSSYGKTFHTWQIERDNFPYGIPQLMMGFTQDGKDRHKRSNCRLSNS